MFDPVKFGEAMGDAIRKAVEPLQQEIVRLKAQIAATPLPANGKDGADGQAGRDGKDCDLEAVKLMLEALVKTMPAPADGKDGQHGKDGVDGKDGTSITLDDVRPVLDGAINAMREESARVIDAAIKSIPVPKDGEPGKDGLRGVDGKPGEKGVDGVGVAGAMIDRDGNLMATLSNGEVKNLGPVVGKNGTDGVDGVGFESFDLEYISETHEIAIKASAVGRVKELRYPAGGIRPAGYWREGTKAKAGEAWVHDGSTYYAKSDTSAKPDSKSDDWIIGARRGRDGERGEKGAPAELPKPILLGGK